MFSRILRATWPTKRNTRSHRMYINMGTRSQNVVIICTRDFIVKYSFCHTQARSKNLFSLASASSHIACLVMKLPCGLVVRFAVPLGMRFDRDERREASAAAAALAAVLVP